MKSILACFTFVSLSANAFEAEITVNTAYERQEVHDCQKTVERVNSELFEINNQLTSLLNRDVRIVASSCEILEVANKPVLLSSDNHYGNTRVKISVQNGRNCLASSNDYFILQLERNVRSAIQYKLVEEVVVESLGGLVLKSIESPKLVVALPTCLFR